MNEVPGVCVTLEPPGPNRVRAYSVISPLASRGRCHTTSMEDDDRFLVDTNSGAELGTEKTPRWVGVMFDDGSSPLYDANVPTNSLSSSVRRYMVLVWLWAGPALVAGVTVKT